ncbi:MATE family efflux transporter [Cypionkella psychrotolerans]|uniref:MATE family efflux transporter n=1 Tax=Cypionkella psychrotolerans TaxID=1678131 RepID=UPI0006B616CD|nr:MATE family efflux transporter [Cypionkella psychrotolerans]
MAEQAVKAPDQQPKFVEGNLFRHITVMSLTNSVGLMAIFAVDLINMVFISMLNQEDITAAVGYAGAILFFTTSFGIGLSIAVSALVARAVGQRNLVMAREKATNGMILGIGFGIIFAAVVWAFLPGIVSLLGAEGRTHALTVHFLRIVIPAQPFLMVGMIGGAILRSHGDAKRAMAATLWGAAANAVLDPILIFGLHMDLTGVAIASVVSRIVIAGVSLVPVIRHHGGFDRPSVEGLKADLAPVYAIAGPAILTQVATPLGQAMVTRMVSGYGEAAVAGMAIAGRLTPVALGVIFALSGAIGPIIGQNYGAGRMDRVSQTFLDGLKFTAIVVAIVTVILFALRAPIADLFHAQGLTRDLVCGPLCLLFFFNGAIFMANAACNNLGKPLMSTLINWGRHTIGTVPFAWWFSHYWGAQGVLIGQALGGVIFGILGVWLAYRMILATPARI